MRFGWLGVIALVGGLSLAAPPLAEAAMPQGVAPVASASVQSVGYFWRGRPYRYRWHGGYYNYFSHGRYYMHRRPFRGGWRYY